MVKLTFRPRYPFVHFRDEKLASQVMALRAENEQLRERLVAAQHEKVGALNQAEELREQKERLREKSRLAVKDLKAVQKVNEELQASLRKLKEENAALRLRKK